jgi:hypothetical protein
MAGGIGGRGGMTGCAPTVAIHPLYTTRTWLPTCRWREPGIGRGWRDLEDREIGRRVRPSIPRTGSTYAVHLLRLKEYEFVDVASKSDPEVGVAGHLFAKIRMEGDELYVSPINEPG